MNTRSEAVNSVTINSGNLFLLDYVIVSMFTTCWRRLWLVKACVSTKCN